VFIRFGDGSPDLMRAALWEKKVVCEALDIKHLCGGGGGKRSEPPLVPCATLRPRWWLVPVPVVHWPGKRA